MLLTHREPSNAFTVMCCCYYKRLYASSSAVNLCCMHWQMKSYAAGDILLKIFLKLIRVESRLDSKPGRVWSTDSKA